MEEETKRNTAPQLIPYHFKKGVSGNPKGRPKGKSLKEFARAYLESLPDNEKIKYLNSLPSEIVWKMSEGNPPQKTTIDGEIKLPQPILELGKKEDEE